MIEAGCDWIDILFNGGGIATGVIAGIVAALVQLLTKTSRSKNGLRTMKTQ